MRACHAVAAASIRISARSMPASTPRFRSSPMRCWATPSEWHMAAPASAFLLSRYLDAVESAGRIPLQGRILRVVGLLIESQGPRARVGEVCDILSDSGPALPVQVVGFRDGVLLTVPLGDVSGIRPGDRIVARKGAIAVDVGPQLLGRVVDALGRPVDEVPLRTTERGALR